MQNAPPVARIPVHGRGTFLAAIPLVIWLGLAGLFGGAAGLGAFTFTYAQGFSYLSNDPRACVNCHVMRDQYDGWNRSSHHAVATCNDCHTPHTSIVSKYAVKAINGFRHSYAFTTGNFPEPIMIVPMDRQITQAACLHCHGDLTSLINHADKSEPTDCLTCHAGVGHGK